MLLASFHSKRTTPSFNDKLNTLVSGILICYTVSISSFGGTRTTPGDLLSFIAFFLKNQLQEDTIINVPLTCQQFIIVMSTIYH